MDSGSWRNLLIALAVLSLIAVSLVTVWGCGSAEGYGWKVSLATEGEVGTVPVVP